MPFFLPLHLHFSCVSSCDFCVPSRVFFACIQKLSVSLGDINLGRTMAQPLAERMRPKTLDEYIGQKHLVGEGAVLRRMIEAGRISSFILWGPP